MDGESCEECNEEIRKPLELVERGMDAGKAGKSTPRGAPKRPKIDIVQKIKNYLAEKMKNKKFIFIGLLFPSHIWVFYLAISQTMFSSRLEEYALFEKSRLAGGDNITDLYNLLNMCILEVNQSHIIIPLLIANASLVALCCHLWVRRSKGSECNTAT